MTQIQKEETKITVITTNEVKQKRIRISLRAVNKAFFSVIIALVLTYIGVANDITVKGFELKDMKKTINEIEDNNRRLEAQITTVNSYCRLEEKIKTLGMVNVGKVNYISSLEGMVAKK